ncbi:sensor histidine kinase [Thermanaeromonas sp.]|uniref:sensor histidine kinase n=1 Tax=Thermanaeromonas sp. TaxID=2003697 RepID=UPI0026096175|nr:ATP-binding protein [Thermanaeromonas sp.]
MIKSPLVLIALFLVLLETLLFVLLNLSFIAAPAFPALWPDAVTAIQIIAPFFIITSLSLIFLLFKYVNIELEASNQRIHIENLRESLENLRAQRHDFMSHLQVVHGLLQLGMTDEAREYVASLCAEIRQPTRIISLNHPALAALIQSKIALAESQGIACQCEVTTELRELIIPGTDITRIFGNLLDNAIEALQRAKGERRLWLRIYEKEEGYIFEVGNTGPAIPLALQAKIFERGFTTKKNKEGHGQGLFIVKTLVDKYEGRISVHSSDQGTVFTLLFPQHRGSQGFSF